MILTYDDLFVCSHVVVFSGDIAVDLRSLTPAKAQAMVRFCRAAVAFSDSVSEAGFGVKEFNADYPEGFADCESQWPVTQSEEDLLIQRGPLTDARSKHLANEFQVYF